MRSNMKTDYLRHDRAVPCPAGEKTRDKHRLVSDGNNLSLTKVDEIDIQKQINSYEDSVSLSAMIARFRKTGDMSFLRGNEGVYADVTGLPTSPLRMIDAARAAQASALEQNASNMPATESITVTDNNTTEVTPNAE